MGFFNSHKKRDATKMFITYFNEVPQTKGMNFSTKTRSSKLGGAMFGPKGVIIEMALNAAPKLIDQGLALLSSTINKMAKKDVTKTIVKRNIEILSNNRISLPNQIEIIRGEFAPQTNEKGQSFGDGHNRNQATLMGNPELHIKIDIVKSKDNKSISFQPTNFFYNGVDHEGDTIDEVVLAIAFVPAGESVINLESITFQNFLHFEGLKAHEKYHFKSNDGYDANLQSSWMQPQLNPEIPYTLLIEIQEIREGNSFAKLIQTVYSENQTYIKEELEAKVKLLEAMQNQQKEKG
jgi:hypothetical protein